VRRRGFHKRRRSAQNCTGGFFQFAPSPFAMGDGVLDDESFDTVGMSEDHCESRRGRRNPACRGKKNSGVRPRAFGLIEAIHDLGEGDRKCRQISWGFGPGRCGRKAGIIGCDKMNNGRRAGRRAAQTCARKMGAREAAGGWEHPSGRLPCRRWRDRRPEMERYRRGSFATGCSFPWVFASDGAEVRIAETV